MPSPGSRLALRRPFPPRRKRQSTSSGDHLRWVGELTLAAKAELLLLNARVLTLDPAHPVADAVAIRGSHIVGAGCAEDLRPLTSPSTEVLDVEGGLAIPAFHDAHCHLLAWARFHSAVDCRHIDSLEDLRAALQKRAESLADGEWVRGNAYDEVLLGRHPDRHDLDSAVSDRPVRLQHRSLHADVLNSHALKLTGLMDSDDRRVERDMTTNEPTGRLYSAGDLLRDHMPRPSYESLARDVQRASDQLIAWGVTSIQDATFTNGKEEWELLHRLAADGHLRVRTFMLAGSPDWRRAYRWRPESDLVRRGPVKLMLDEATSDPEAFRVELHAARREGNAVAVHAVTEAEVAMALDAFCSAPPGPLSTPNRLEHAAVVPDSLLVEIRNLGITVVGQPALVFERGDVYRGEYAPEQQAWLHRGRSWITAGVPFAAGSDAPVTEPNPAIGLAAARYRSTRGGSVLGPDEGLTKIEALRAFALGPAQAIGVNYELGRIRPGMLADIAVLDPDGLDLDPATAAARSVRMTIMNGRVAWQRA